MTARPARAARPHLRVVAGAGRRRPNLGAWVLFTLLSIGLFFALILSRVALDAPAMELHDITSQIEAEKGHYQELRLEVARLQAPDRVLPRAEELGLVKPDDVRLVMADLDQAAPENRWVEVKSILAAAP